MISKISSSFLIFTVLFISLLSSCGKSEIDLGFNTKEWQEDKDACNGVRKANLENFEASKNKIMGLNQKEVLQALGKPDIQELHKRGQKFYTYYLEPGGQCDGINAKKGKAVRMRLSALDVVNEISYENF